MCWLFFRGQKSGEQGMKMSEAKGYSDEWIEKRVRGIAVRQELTGEWKNRGVEEGKEFAILTNELSQATFGKTFEDNCVFNFFLFLAFLLSEQLYYFYVKIS